MEIPESVTKLNLGRGGTFFGSFKEFTPELRARVNILLEKAMAQSSQDEEESAVLKTLYHDILADEAITSDIREEASVRRFHVTQQEIDWIERHPENQWTAYLIYRYQFKMYPILKKLLNFPLHLLIEPTSVCNLRCVMCYQVDASFFNVKSLMGFMPWELFTSVVDQARENKCHALTLASRGEPTLHPRFGEMLLYLHDAGVMDSKINTNATRLTEKLCHDILAAQVSEVVFSVDAGTKETYEKIRVKGKFEEVLANIERFNEIRVHHYPKTPTITRISGVMVSEEQNLEQMKNFWGQLVDEVTIKKATPRWDTYNNEKIDVPHPCSLLWERMYVWHDGTTNPCDVDYKSYLSAGNAREKSLSEIWLGETYQKLRQDHLKNRRGSRIPCDRCSFY